MTTALDLTAALERAHCALAILEEQAAGFGALHIPVHLKIELEAKRREVVELEARLNGSATAAAPPPVFDQRGQHVGTQINVAGDYHAPSAQPTITGTPSTNAPPVDSALIARIYPGLQRLDAVEIETLCLVHCPQIYDKFGRGQRRDEMINTILEHCRLKPEDAAELVKHLK